MSAAMSPSELNRLCSLPGREGALWRLLRAWDPDRLQLWLMEERKKGLTPDDAVHCVATAMSGAAFALAQQVGGDKRGCLLGERGLTTQLRIIIEHHLTQVGGAHRIITPRGRGLIT